jgi:hypothetical protein
VEGRAEYVAHTVTVFDGDGGGSGGSWMSETFYRILIHSEKMQRRGSLFSLFHLTPPSCLSFLLNPYF